MPTLFLSFFCVHLNELIFQLVFAAVLSVSCVHTPNSHREEDFSIAKSHLGEIAY